MLIETLRGHDYSRVDDRAFEKTGVIVDLGCNGWDWGSVFLGKKRYIGADPFAQERDDAELFKGVVGAKNISIEISTENDKSSIMVEVKTSRVISTSMVTWRVFCNSFAIEQVAVLKMNIEGAEYELIDSMTPDDFSKIDQLAISFHDWMIPQWKVKTERAIVKLERLGFGVQKIDARYGWHLAIRNP